MVVVWIFASSTSSLKAQSDKIPLEEQLLAAFDGLDQSEITTGILYERVPEYVPLNYLDGREFPDSLAMDRESYKFAYGMIRQAHIDKSGLPDMQSFINTSHQMKDSNITILSLLYYEYNRFKDNVIEDSLLVIDTIAKKINRGSDLSISPYIKDTVLTFTSMVNESHSLVQQFIFDQSMIFTNIPIGFAGAEIDFGDGLGYRQVSFDNYINVTFPNHGRYVIKLKLIGERGTEYFAKTYIEITPEISGSPYNEPIASDLVYDEGVEIWHIRNELCGNNEVHKPLILLEGWDPLNDFNPEHGYRILDNNLGNALYPEEYDVFFINYKNSTIDIFQQGEYVREAIEWINTQKSDTWNEENVVVGFSMGGLVGKIALRNMELEGEDHQTRLFFTYDTPLKGANQPLGLQLMLTHVANYHLLGISISSWWFADNMGMTDGLAALNCKSARQMLYYYYAQGDWENVPGLSDTYFTADAENLDDQHDDFYNQFESLGNLDIPELAISKGPIVPGGAAVIGQYFLPGEDLINEHMSLSTLVEWGIWDDFVEFISGWVLGATFHYYANVKALPDGDGRVYRGSLTITILGLGFADTEIRDVTNALPYDSAPGAMLENQVANLPFYYPTFCFVPTISSLALDDINNDINPYYTNDLTNPNNVLPFTHLSNYIGNTHLRNWSIFPAATFSDFHDPRRFFGAYARDFALEYLRSSNLLISPMTDPTILNLKTFNYGKHEVVSGILPLSLDNVIDFNLEVFDDGKLWFNRNDVLAFTDAPNPINNSPQDYIAVIKGSECGTVPTTVEISDGGELIVGDQSVDNFATLKIRDNGTLIAGEGESLIKVEDQSEIVVIVDGKLEIENNGMVTTTWGSKIKVENGGVLHVKQGGTLRVQHYSDLIVEDGGKLIIDEGAKIQLWSSNNIEDGEANIHIKNGGELVWNGKPDISGNGYFEFDQGNILTLNTDFEISGINQNVRMIELNKGAVLDVQNYNLILSNGKIVYNSGSLIKSTNNNIDVNYVDFESISSSRALLGVDILNTQIYHCNIVGFRGEAIELQGESSNNNYSDVIFDCNFEDNEFSLSFYDRRTSSITNSNFTGELAVLADNCLNVYMDECYTDCLSGVLLQGVNNFTMQGGKIQFRNTGIDAKTGSNNLSLIDGAEIIGPSAILLDYESWSNKAAIEINGAIDLQGNINGKVYMACSKIESFNGIVGTNVTLDIDVIDNGDMEFPNVFICKYAFVICYYQAFSNLIGPIYARGNYWREGPTEIVYPHPYGYNIYSFHDIGYGETCGQPLFNDHALIYDPVFPDYPESCFDKEGHQNMHTSISDNEMNPNITIYPNPTDDFFYIQTNNQDKYMFTLLNIFGQKMMEKTVKNGEQINIGNIDSGVYIYTFVDENNNSESGKLLIQN